MVLWVCLCRYPFYMLACIGTEWKLLTWLRYSLWIPLYPLGTIAEGLGLNFLLLRHHFVNHYIVLYVFESRSEN